MVLLKYTAHVSCQSSLPNKMHHTPTTCPISTFHSDFCRGRMFTTFQGSHPCMFEQPWSLECFSPCRSQNYLPSTSTLWTVFWMVTCPRPQSYSVVKPECPPPIILPQPSCCPLKHREKKHNITVWSPKQNTKDNVNKYITIPRSGSQRRSSQPFHRQAGSQE